MKEHGTVAATVLCGLLCLGIPTCNFEREANRAVVYRYFDEVVDQGKAEVVQELFSPDAKQHFTPCLEIEGWQNIMAYVGLTALLGQSFQTTIHEIVVGGTRHTLTLPTT